MHKFGGTLSRIARHAVCATQGGWSKNVNCWDRIRYLPSLDVRNVPII